MADQSRAPVDKRAPRTFTCPRYETSGYYSLRVLVEGKVVQRVILTEDEVRACAETLLAAIGWTPVVGEGGTREKRGSDDALDS
jgi:hypothetical protein